MNRDLTLGELRRILAEYPDHQPVAPVVNGMVGVMTGVREMTTDSDGTLLLIGEADLPMDLIEANIELNREAPR